ncbi:hypothetical protein POPTR_003G005400v4 [Populus trichocarpa]|uniref:Uncharacterized protein n=2 Tax=Populus trichocarpa TaxID=3694 RepID=A0ACC0T6L6_POPTR|nr:uncharacterized protein LOC112326892 [Populus trichocarpa]KAI5593287.1 hypothetical protein BDE02_03G004400 [Populus trichocarpa]KAI5593288.1 hypothetical protein BDE02_03G004400 [Populus trichocarpa]KAI9397177.1 hypothetical protein POPTR_003G005400v4 [Populus trichocarpa]KAI9397178.1 hypothetical protein POPTR_003G005400v4 [Populus trichocarpa]
MSGFLRRRNRSSLLFSLFLLSVPLPFFSGIADDSSGAKNGTMKSDKHAASTNNTGIPKIAIIFVSMVAIGFLAFFLFKFWQKKKREEQYARLLKLFEEDDELEVELGLRD